VTGRSDAVVIRTASTSDVEALADVYVSSARHHAALDPAFYNVPGRDAVVRHLRDALADEDEADVVRLVAEVDGTVVGSADVQLRSPGPASMLITRGAASRPR